MEFSEFITGYCQITPDDYKGLLDRKMVSIRANGKQFVLHGNLRLENKDLSNLLIMGWVNYNHLVKQTDWFEYENEYAIHSIEQYGGIAS